MIRCRLAFYGPSTAHRALVFPDDLFSLFFHEIFYRAVMLWGVERESVGVRRGRSLIEPGEIVGCCVTKELVTNFKK